jgi:hypothetical protein
MNFILFTLAILIPVMSSASQDSVDIDAIRNAFESRKLSEKELAPNGFRKVAEAKGDLNADGIPDMAIIVHRLPKNSPASSLPEEDIENDEDEDVRQYVVLFLGDKLGKYAFWKLGATHILDTNPNFMVEYGVGDFEIKKGVLSIASSISMSMGGWSAGGCTQKWRNEKSGFRLIGLTITDVNRGCACGSTTDINFLTGLEIYGTDRDRNGNQTGKEQITKTKRKRKAVLWEHFDYEEMCQSG